MTELLVGFIVVTVILTFITLLGHGLWLMAAAFFRTLFGGGRELVLRGQPCPRCGNHASLIQGACTNCTYRTSAARRSELDTTIKLIGRLHDSGTLTDRDFNHVMQALHAEAKSLHLVGGMAGGLDPRFQSVISPSAAVPPESSQPTTPTSKAPQGGTPFAPPLTSEPSIQETAGATGTTPPSEPDEIEILEAEIVDTVPPTAPAPTAAPTVHRAVHPLDAPEPEPAVAPTATFSPQRTMADMLQRFMEEKNIRWGELASGILIVGSAIGLVISLRAQLEKLSEQIPYFPALLLMLGTVAIHAAGLYTLRRWKLRSTSRGVLIIATLLVPLSFAAGIMLSGSGDDRVAVGSPFYIAAVVIGLLGYGAVTSLSARALFPEGWWRLTVAVMGTSAGQLVINRLADNESSTTLWVATALFALPLASYLIATLAQLQIISAKQRLTPVRAAQTFTILGIASFALLVPLALQAGISEAVRETIAALSPSLSVAAAVVLCMGITIQRRCESTSMGETRMVGTAMALLGGMIMLGTVFAAWPDPTFLIAVATVTAITLATLAIVGRIPILHAGAVAAASFATLLVYHHATGRFEMEDGPRGVDLIRAVLMGRSAIVLLAPALLSGIAGLVLVQQQRRWDGLTYLASAAGTATASLAIALYAGFWTGEDANWTTLIFALYAVGALAIVPLLKRQAVSWAGSAALLVAVVHLLWMNTWFADRLAAMQLAPERPLLLAILTHGLLVAIYGLALYVWQLRSRVATGSEQESKPTWLQMLPLSGAITAALTVPFVLYVPTAAYGDHGAYAVCVALVWAIAAGVMRDARLATAAHAAATVAVAFVTAAIAGNISSWTDGLQDLHHWQLQLSVLGLWCMLATGVRLLTRQRSQLQLMFKPEWPSIDQLLLGALLVALVFVGATGCWAGVGVELGALSPESATAQDVWHTVGYGGGSWIALACIIGAVLLLLYEQVTVTRLAGLVISTAVVPLLISGSFEPSQAVASALRWTFAIFTFAWIMVITFREPIQKRLVQAIPSVTAIPSVVATSTRDLATLLGVIPVAALTTAAVVQVSHGVSFNGPAAASLFGVMGDTLLYATPLALLVVGIVVIAVRDGSALFAFLGSLLLQYFVALAVLLPTLSEGGNWSTSISVLLAQWSACSLAGYALIWTALSPWIDRHTPRDQNWLFQLQLVAASAATIALAAWALGPIFFDPQRVHSVVDDLGLWPSYLAAGLASLAMYWHCRSHKRGLALLGVIGPSVFATLAAASSNAFDPTANWLAYHVLTGALLMVALGAVAVGGWQQTKALGANWLAYLRRSANVVALAVFSLMVRGCIEDPIAAWWTIFTATGLLIYFIAQGALSRKQVYAYLTAAVSLFATSVVWCHWAPGRIEEFVTGFIYVNVIAASLVAIGFLALDVWHQRKEGELWDPTFPLVPAHSLLAISCTGVMALFGIGGTTISLLAGLGGDPRGLVIADAWGMAALTMLGLLLIGLLWEQRIGLNLMASYLWGYVAIALFLNLLQQTALLGTGRDGASWLIVGAGLAGAAYVALTGHLWKWGANVAQWGARLQVPGPVEKLEHISRWLPTFNLIATFVICGLGFVTIFTSDERSMRVTVAFAPVLLAYGVSCLAQQQRKINMQLLTLFLVVIGAIFIGWADVTAPAGDAGVLAYCARLLVVLAGMTLLYSVGVTRWIGSTSTWFDAVRRSGVILAVTTVTALASVLALEVALFKPGTGAPIATPEVIAISVMLFGFLVALLSMAILPGRDPLALSDKGRQGYVYGAQAIAALLFAHIYLAKPKLFELGLMDYWPYIVMGIAFGSVAFAEFCFRKGWHVIAEPMQRTGGFLPLLPALTAWTFGGASSYPLVLFFAGLIYVFMSVSRRSYVAGIAAAVMGNGALWAMFNDTGLHIADSPQLWMIPPALSVLGASYINRDRLSDNTLTAVRYICVMVIYLSSTGEMFMKLLPQDANDWVRPLVLTSLSVGGIFAGIALRVRAFLYLGSSFLLLSIVAMVWNAQRMVGHTWPWWVFGISMGLVILVIFGLFEKHRQEVQQLVARLRQWEP